jgi:PEP-CTERM motif
MKSLVVVLFLSLVLVGPAFADTFVFSGQTDFAACQSIDITCDFVEFSGTMTATPGHNAYGDVFYVTLLTGIFDDYFPMIGSGGFLIAVPPDEALPNHNYIPLENPFAGGGRGLTFTENGQLMGFGFDQHFTSTVMLEGAQFAFVTWDVKPVATPEPPTYLLLGMGLVAVMVLNWKKPILARIRCG